MDSFMPYEKQAECQFNTFLPRLAERSKNDLVGSGWVNHVRRPDPRVEVCWTD